MRILPPVEEQIRRVIRDERAKDPLITVSDPAEVMAREFRYDPLPPEVRSAVIAAWIRGNLLPRAAIEQMIPAGVSLS